LVVAENNFYTVVQYTHGVLCNVQGRPTFNSSSQLKINLWENACVCIIFKCRNMTILISLLFGISEFLLNTQINVEQTIIGDKY